MCICASKSSTTSATKARARAESLRLVVTQPFPGEGAGAAGTPAHGADVHGLHDAIDQQAQAMLLPARLWREENASEELVRGRLRHDLVGRRRGALSLVVLDRARPQEQCRHIPDESLADEATAVLNDGRARQVLDEALVDH